MLFFKFKIYQINFYKIDIALIKFMIATVLILLNYNKISCSSYYLKNSLEIFIESLITHA